MTCRSVNPMRSMAKNPLSANPPPGAPIRRLHRAGFATLPGGQSAAQSAPQSAANPTAIRPRTGSAKGSESGRDAESPSYSLFLALSALRTALTCGVTSVTSLMYLPATQAKSQSSASEPATQGANKCGCRSFQNQWYTLKPPIWFRPLNSTQSSICGGLPSAISDAVKNTALTLSESGSPIWLLRARTCLVAKAAVSWDFLIVWLL